MKLWKVVQSGNLQSANRIDDFYLFNDEEENVSRNYLMILEDRLSSKSIADYQSESSPTTTTFGNAIPSQPSSITSSTIGTSSGSSKYRPGDKLIIKAKVYILQILEVLRFFRREKSRFLVYRN
jgi:hypothetical protein